MADARSKARFGLIRAVRRLPSPRDENALQALGAARRVVTGAPAPKPATTPGTKAPSRGKGKRVKPVTVMERRITRAFRSGKPGQLRKVGRELKSLRRHAEALATPDYIDDRQSVETGGVKSTQYMIDLIPHVQRLMAEHPRLTKFTVLDVGPGAGYGTELLAGLYRSKALGYQLKVSALDIVDDYAAWFATRFPDIEFIHADVFDHDRTYDIILSSHAIEHIDEPVEFCQRLQQMAKLAVFVSAPYKEPADKLTAGHVNSIDDELIKQLGADEVTVYNSVCWGAFMDPPYECFVARLPGLA